MTDKPIDRFDKEYRFLSNFSPHPVRYMGQLYPTSEHAYQAAKATNERDRAYVASALTANGSKKRGKEIKLKPDWDRLLKKTVMRSILRAKFPWPLNELSCKLLATYPRNLIEGNYWGDTFWGVCHGVGTNHLGKMLERRRSYLICKVLGQKDWTEIPANFRFCDACWKPVNSVKRAERCQC